MACSSFMAHPGSQHEELNSPSSSSWLLSAIQRSKLQENLLVSTSNRASSDAKASETSLKIKVPRTPPHAFRQRNFEDFLDTSTDIMLHDRVIKLRTEDEYLTKVLVEGLDPAREVKICVGHIIASGVKDLALNSDRKPSNPSPLGVRKMQASPVWNRTEA
ncbi:hypothetical protein O6H91_16G006200 [Diphasiastrum complanatum]|uniref:Uncharacterized protein n=1 Tax=Diphasiastrum complanatum TaxID=34168 RepID=A0ACC2B9L3_DIPCM|nr:hypothetical protein O6H91_16G006200 [Diphasiastrum complanatum]